MSVGFVMLVHTGFDRTAGVVKMLSQAECPVAIHIDARVGSEADRFQAKMRPLPNVTFTERRACKWGTWSLVQASRDGAADLIRNHSSLSHVYLISGACLPIKPLSDLKSFLAANRDVDFIESVTIRDVPWTQGGLSDERFTMTFPFAWRTQRRLFDFWVKTQRLVGFARAMPEGLKPHLGSQWWCLSRGTLETILLDTRASEMERYFRQVWIPDESYFQSLVRLYGTKVESRSLTLSKFNTRGKPHVFYDDHLALLRQSPAFFARKVWPGADRLYRAFLEGKTISAPVSKVSPTQIDRTFSQAISRQTRGRAGLFMISRFPDKDSHIAATAAPYAVFHGFGDIFHEFARWIRTKTGSRVHSNLFHASRVDYFGGQSGYAGALSDSSALRDYDPEQFLRNLTWNTRGEHQSFLFAARDRQDIWPFMAADRNANISLVTGAWALSVLGSGQSLKSMRREAAILQKREAKMLATLGERTTRAQVRSWTLAEFLERPMDPLQEIVDGLSGADPQFLSDLPEFKPMKGLPTFLQALKNAGMNPYTAGQISEQVVDRILDSKLAGSAQ